MDVNPAILGEERRREVRPKTARVFELINAYRVRGHLIADLDPLRWKKVLVSRRARHRNVRVDDMGPRCQFITTGVGGGETATLREIVDRLHAYYCGTVASSTATSEGRRKRVDRARVEPNRRPVPVESEADSVEAISAELFEKFLGRSTLGRSDSNRSNETVIAVLDQLIEGAAVRA